MNSKAFCLSLLILSTCMHGKERFSHKHLKIDHQIITLIDGTPRIDIVKILNLEDGIKRIQDGDENGGTIHYEGKRLTIKELVDIEKKLKGKQTPKLNKALHDAIASFEVLTREYLREARGFKGQMCALISRWADQRNVKSILVQWGNQSDGQELEQLKKLAETFEDFDSLLSDLSRFLKDLRFSCKKSWDKFKKINK